MSAELGELVNVYRWLTDAVLDRPGG